MRCYSIPRCDVSGSPAADPQYHRTNLVRIPTMACDVPDPRIPRRGGECALSDPCTPEIPRGQRTHQVCRTWPPPAVSSA